MLQKRRFYDIAKMVNIPNHFESKCWAFVDKRTVSTDFDQWSHLCIKCKMNQKCRSDDFNEIIYIYKLILYKNTKKIRHNEIPARNISDRL